MFLPYLLFTMSAYANVMSQYSFTEEELSLSIVTCDKWKFLFGVLLLDCSWLSFILRRL